MKKIINGKLYDTSTAKNVGSWDNGISSMDFDYVSEILYLKKTGEFFLYGEGGGNSRYGEWHGNSGGPGEEIMPFTEEEARIWAEKLDAADYEKIFGTFAEEETAMITLRTTVSIKEKFDSLKSEKGLTSSELLEYLINRVTL